MPAVASDSPDPSTIPGYFTSDHLVINGAPTPVSATLIPGTLPRGAVLGQQSGTGMYGLCDATQTDGRQTPSAILASPADTVNNLPAMIYTAGQFTQEWLLYHTSWTLPAITYALRSAGLLCFTRAGGFSRPGRI